METIISFFKRRWWSFIPLLMCVFLFFLSWEFGENQSKDNLLQTIGGLAFFSFPGTLPLLFVRRRLFNMWSIFAVFYLVFGTIFLSTADSNSWLLSERAGYTIYLGIGFFIVTFLWSIIHTLILRHLEKKVNQIAP